MVEMTKTSSFWTRRNRETTITATEVYPFDLSFVPIKNMDDFVGSDREWLRQAIENHDEVWQLRVRYRTGLDIEESFFELFPNCEEAEARAAEFAKGGQYEKFSFLRPKDTKFHPEKLSPETSISIHGRGGPPYGLVYDALHGAGLYEHFSPSALVLKWVGGEGAKLLEERYGENWSAVAILEYCVKHFDPTSLATLAARVMVADFVSDYDFDIGYASRELEFLYSGAEKEALKSMARSNKAGESGGRSSTMRKKTNLEFLMNEIEALAGTVGLFSEERIIQQAWDTAQSKYPDMPKSKTTKEDYETIIRSEEPFRARYQIVFRKDA